jgi:hypothetical protein
MVELTRDDHAMAFGVGQARSRADEVLAEMLVASGPARRHDAFAVQWLCCNTSRCAKSVAGPGFSCKIGFARGGPARTRSLRSLS